MNKLGLFDVLGPIMIGPSSSHTAGAVRLGKVAGNIVNFPFESVEFQLHGSFAKTKEGHGTDKALLAGVLGMDPDNENIKNSFELAKERGLNFSYNEKDLGYVHPNTVKIVFKKEGLEPFYVMGSSIGGGNIRIVDINGIDIEFSGDNPTLIIKYEDQKGVIARVSSILAFSMINIAGMKVIRENNIATMILETDDIIDPVSLELIGRIEHIVFLESLDPIGG